MDALKQLNDEKDQVLSRISEAAQNRKVAEVLRDCARLEQIESLIHRYAGLVSEIEGLRNSEEKMSIPSFHEVATRNSEITTGGAVPNAGREIGRTIRESFLNKLLRSGIELRQIKGAYYRTSSGSRVGIAFATERQPDRWFLGLTTNSFDHAVLLCQSETLGTIEICLPRDFFAKYGERMSLSNAQMKFNVVRKGKTFSLLVPGTDGVSTSEFLGNYSCLR
jgi:hypothetical protein